MPHRRFSSPARGRKTTRLALALLALALAGLGACVDDPTESITEPRTLPATSISTGGTWAPGLDPAVRNPPFVVAPGKTYRI
jgi:hypothetical protein